MKAAHAVRRLVVSGLSVCLAFFLSSVYAQSSIHQLADHLQLATQSGWLNLLHFKHGESEIDDQAFFLSAEGKYDPNAELHSTLEALITDTSDRADHVYCRYPARSRWLIEQLPVLMNHIQLPKCPQVAELYHQLDPDLITLVYASAHINSPASAFGHTFLRVDSTLRTPLSAFAINYAAQTTETNGLIYAYKGLFGGYEGRYSLILYSERLKEYSELEQRDLWEYRLNLDHEELARLIYHVIELQPYYANYYFASENCSYNLLWLLQVARPGVELTNKVGSVVAPIETIRMIEAAGLIENENYRASSRKRMVKLADTLIQHQKPLFIPVHHAVYATDVLRDYNTEDKIRTLELTVFELKRQYSRLEISDEDYRKRLLQLLRVRSNLVQTMDVPIQSSVSPLASHPMRRLSIGVKQNVDEDNTRLMLSGRIAYHDLYDSEKGSLPGSFINFFHTEVSVGQHTTRLDSMQALDIHSYALGDTLVSPKSWQVELGVRRIFDDDLYGYLRAGMGYTFGNADVYGFMLASPGMYYYPKTIYSGTIDVGFLVNSDQTKWGIMMSHEWFDTNQKEQIQKVFMTFSLSKNMALNTELIRKKRTNEGHVSTLQLKVFYYF